MEERNIADVVSRKVIEYTIYEILRNVSTDTESEHRQDIVMSVINAKYPQLFVLEQNTPFGIALNRFMSTSYVTDGGPIYLENFKSFLSEDPTTNSLLNNAIYMFSSGYSLQLNELRHIIPNDVDKILSYVQEALSENEENGNHDLSCEFFTWGHLEDPGYKETLKVFLNKNANILKSAGNALSDVHNFPAIMRRIQIDMDISNTPIPDTVIKEHSVSEKLQKELTSSIDYENFINYTKSVLSLNGQNRASYKLLKYIDDIKRDAPTLKNLINSPYQDDMSDALVYNIHSLNHTYMLIEGLILYLMDVTFKDAIVLPSMGDSVIINNPVYQKLATGDDPNETKIDILNVMYYLSNNTAPVSSNAKGINRWVPYRGGISYRRVQDLSNKATDYRERTERTRSENKRRQELSKIRDIVSEKLDEWFLSFKEQHEIQNNPTYERLHKSGKQTCLNRIKETEENQESLIVQSLMDYFVSVRKSQLLKSLYHMTSNFYVHRVSENETTDDVDDKEKVAAIDTAIIKTFLDPIMTKYIVALPSEG